MSSIYFLVTSVLMYNLFNSAFFWAPTTYKMAVRKDWGLKNLEIMMTLLILMGSFLNSSSYCHLCSKLINQESRDLLLG